MAKLHNRPNYRILLESNVVDYVLYMYVFSVLSSGIRSRSDVAVSTSLYAKDQFLARRRASLHCCCCGCTVRRRANQDSVETSQ